MGEAAAAVVHQESDVEQAGPWRAADSGQNADSHSRLDLEAWVGPPAEVVGDLIML